jgi:type III pantothenate kinase
VTEKMASLVGDNPDEWQSQLRVWQLTKHLVWAVAGVQHHWQARFLQWAESRGDTIHSITREQIPIPIDVDEPGAVGIDRLLNAFAATRLVPTKTRTVVISVGTAVTVDLVREDGAFAGGTILPGPRLMAEALHRFTAKLPLVDINNVGTVGAPGKNTTAAIRAGISAAIMGGAALLVDQMTGSRKSQSWVILTGGALGDLGAFDFGNVAHTMIARTLTLEGIRIAAEALP